MPSTTIIHTNSRSCVKLPSNISDVVVVVVNMVPQDAWCGMICKACTTQSAKMVLFNVCVFRPGLMDANISGGEGG